MPGPNCEKLNKIEDELCLDRNMKSRKVQVEPCQAKLGKANFWLRPVETIDI